MPECTASETAHLHSKIGKRKNDHEQSLMRIKDEYFSSPLTNHLKIGHSEGKEHFSSPLTKHLKIGHSEEKKTVTFILTNAEETTSLSNRGKNAKTEETARIQSSTTRQQQGPIKEGKKEANRSIFTYLQKKKNTHFDEILRFLARVHWQPGWHSLPCFFTWTEDIIGG